ncbi:MAG: hypothetical protein V4510_12665 [bacterium]
MSAKKNAEALIRAGETAASETGLFWWQHSEAYWFLPLYAEMGMCCTGLLSPDLGDWQAAREQLWSIREELS